MKIGLNATCLNDRPSGAKQRFAGIYGALVRKMKHAEFVVYEPADCRVAQWFGGAENVSTRQTPLPSEARISRLIKGMGYWPTQLKRDALQVLECFSQPLVKSPTGTTLTTIHDIRRIRTDANRLERAAYAASLRATFAKADCVITVSEAMRQEILTFEPRARVSVVYNGLDPAPVREVTSDQMEAVRRKFALPAEFVLAVGHFEARKNYVRLVEAIARLRGTGRECYLVIVGNDSGGRQIVERRIAETNMNAHVRLLGGLSDLEVRCLYRLSRAFVFPSTYEGFGIPILEAMAAGTPFVLSDLPVFREITQDRGVYFPPLDVEAMAECIGGALDSASLRSALVDLGSGRVLDFGFDRLADQIAGLYSH